MADISERALYGWLRAARANDTVGDDTQERSWKVLKKGGALVSI